MIEKISGIVLRTVKYGEKSLIIDMYTESHGRQSFMTSIPSGKAKATSRALWQPLSMVEFVADIRPHGRMPKPKDVASAYNYVDMPYNPIKSTVAFFIAEFLCGALRNEQPDRPLYLFIIIALKWLDTIDDERAIANFHLVFIMKMTRFLGIMPNIEVERGESSMFFDLLAGTFCAIKPPHSYSLLPSEAQTIPLLIKMDFGNCHRFHLTRPQRHRILDILNTYYRLHIPQFPELKSIEVLKEVFD